MPYPSGEYGIQNFYSLQNSLGESDDFNGHFDEVSEDEFLLLLFSVEDCYYWTNLKKEPTDLAVIYSSDEPTIYPPDYDSLAAILESIITRLKIS